MKIVIKQLLFIIALTMPLNAFAADKSALTVNQAIETALKGNPNYAQIQARYKSLQDIPSQEGALPDPTIALNGMNLPANDFDTKQEGMTQIQFGISQAFPFPGKLALKERAAEYLAAAELDNVYELHLKLKQQVTSSWWELYYIERSLEVIKANLNLLRQFVKVAETKYKVGDGLQQDVLLAQLELSKLLEQEIRVKSLKKNEAATLNTLMGEGAHKTLSLSKLADKSLSTIPLVEDLIAQANETSPLLKKDDNLILAAESRLALAEKEYYPDFKVGVNYGDRSGNNVDGSRRDDVVSLMFNMSVPLYASSKQDKGVSQRKNELSQRQYSRQDTQNDISSRIVILSSNYLKSRDLFNLFDTGIIPQAQQTVDSMLSGYKVSKVDFLNLVRSQITLLNYQIRYWRALSQGKQFLAKLDEITVGEDPYE
tara:strand:+ start:8248 stop:9531 length:1284 start_codon:yes stop_codon:yes gene_type:complete